jgi:hypothetical protein
MEVAIDYQQQPTPKVNPEDWHWMQQFMAPAPSPAPQT